MPTLSKVTLGGQFVTAPEHRQCPIDPSERREADPRIPHSEWAPQAGRPPAGDLRALVDATDNSLTRNDYVDIATREIPGASGSMAEQALDRILRTADTSLPTPDDNVDTLANRIEQALRDRDVPSDHIAVRPERRSRVVTILVTSRATARDRDVVWETVGDSTGVTYQQMVNRWRIDVDAVLDAWRGVDMVRTGGPPPSPWRR